jgi:hypothetical protein
MRKRKSTTQKNHLIFYLSAKEKQFATWRSKKWSKTKLYIDAVCGIFDFYGDKFNNWVGDGMKNPRVLEQEREVKALNSIWRHMKLKHIKLLGRNKRQKLMYAPNSHKDISFNQNLVSKFGTAE